MDRELRMAAPRAPLLWAGLSLAALAWNTRAVDRFHLVRLSVTTAVALAAAVAMLLIWGWLRWRGKPANGWLSALCLGTTAGAWLQIQSLPMLPSGLRVTLLLTALLTPAIILACSRNAALLGRIGLALFTFATLFTVSGIGLARFWSSDSTWPRVSAEVQRDMDRVYLLLDESNADIYGPFVAFARGQQLPVLDSTTLPLGRDTAEVVPQWFSNHHGTNWRPCTATAVCAPDAAVDFARISASRPDIDVVGFYFPYCSMKGLRSCEAPWTSWATTFDGRLCDWAKTPGFRNIVSPDRCAADAADGKGRLATELLTHYWRLPFWRDGGMVFAHLPIPHPPNAHHAASLDQDYRAGVKQANDIAIETLKRLIARQRPFELAIFSDHPLRVASWCARYWPSDDSCTTVAQSTKRIPRIVVTDRAHAPRSLDASALTPIQ